MATRRPAKPSPAQSAADLRAYFAALPPAARRRIKQMREVIRAIAPSATEVISYRIPAFKLDGRMLLWYAAWTEHTSLYPVSAALLRAHGIESKGHMISKGTIRFALDAPLPVTLVKRIVKARVAESWAAVR